MAFGIDALARRVLGWRAAYRINTVLALDMLKHSVFTRRQAGITDPTELVAANSGRLLSRADA